MYTFHATTLWSLRTCAISSRCALASPMLGNVWPCTSTRPRPHSSVMIVFTSSMSSIDSGLPSPGIGIADITIFDVSLLRNISSMRWSTEKHARGSDSPQRCCGNSMPSPSPPGWARS